MNRGLVSATLAALLVASTATRSTAREDDAVLPPEHVPPHAHAHPHAHPHVHAPVPVPVPGYVPIQQPGYVRLSAPLNPVPQPNIPYQVGGSLITNEALYAHEMLYPHQYRALYGPYYYRVKNRWYLTPRGYLQQEHWELEGTEVKVKYHSAIAPFALFMPPGR
jgi:hypothetical protein